MQSGVERGRSLPGTDVFWIAIICCGLLLSLGAVAYSLRGLLSDEEPGSDAHQAGANAAAEIAEQTPVPKAKAATGPVSLSLDDIREILSALDPPQRIAVLERPESFRKLVAREGIRRSVLAAARASGLDSQDDVRFLVARRAEQLLAEIYLNRNAVARLPAGFPSDEQLRDAYDANPGQFVAPERVHVWQIFLPLAPGADDAASGKLDESARTLVQKLKSGKLSFEQAAVETSRHDPSRLSGGYMGLLKVADLVPELRGELMALKEGEIGGPFRSSQGLHVMRRGALVPARPVPFDAIKEQLRKKVRANAVAQFRQQLSENARRDYGNPIDDETLDAWHESLKSSLGSPVVR